MERAGKIGTLCPLVLLGEDLTIAKMCHRPGWSKSIIVVEPTDPASSSTPDFNGAGGTRPSQGEDAVTFIRELGPASLCPNDQLICVLIQVALLRAQDMHQSRLCHPEQASTTTFPCPSRLRSFSRAWKRKDQP